MTTVSAVWVIVLLVVGLQITRGGGLCASLLDSVHDVGLLIEHGIAEPFRPIEVGVQAIDDVGIVDQREDRGIPVRIRLERRIGVLLLEKALGLDELDAGGAGRQHNGEDLIRIEGDRRNDDAQLVGGKQAVIGLNRGFLRILLLLGRHSGSRAENCQADARGKRPQILAHLQNQSRQTDHLRTPLLQPVFKTKCGINSARLRGTVPMSHAKGAPPFYPGADCDVMCFRRTHNWTLVQCIKPAAAAKARKLVSETARAIDDIAQLFLLPRLIARGRLYLGIFRRLDLLDQLLVPGPSLTAGHRTLLNGGGHLQVFGDQLLISVAYGRMRLPVFVRRIVGALPPWQFIRRECIFRQAGRIRIVAVVQCALLEVSNEGVARRDHAFGRCACCRGLALAGRDNEDQSGCQRQAPQIFRYH